MDDRLGIAIDILSCAYTDLTAGRGACFTCTEEQVMWALEVGVEKLRDCQED